MTAITETRFNSGMVSHADNTCFQNDMSEDIRFICWLFPGHAMLLVSVAALPTCPPDKKNAQKQ